jgi:hypothetical protein
MRGLAAAVLLAAAVTAALAGCAGSKPGAAAPDHGPFRSTAASSGRPAAPVPAASLPVSLPTANSVNYGDPSAVSGAAIIVQWTMDTVTDSSPYQAELRSAPFLTPAYLAVIKAGAPVTGPGYQWQEWAAHRAYTTVSLLAEDDGGPTDTVTDAYEQWGVTVTPHGTDGWTGAPEEFTVFVDLTRSGPAQPWLVSSMLVDAA